MKIFTTPAAAGRPATADLLTASEFAPLVDLLPSHFFSNMWQAHGEHCLFSDSQFSCKSWLMSSQNPLAIFVNETLEGAEFSPPFTSTFQQNPSKAPRFLGAVGCYHWVCGRSPTLMRTGLDRAYGHKSRSACTLAV